MELCCRYLLARRGADVTLVRGWPSRVRSITTPSGAVAELGAASLPLTLAGREALGLLKLLGLEEDSPQLARPPVLKLEDRLRPAGERSER